jgi:hypothetical protein
MQAREKVGQPAESQSRCNRLKHILAHRGSSESVVVAALTVHLDDSGTSPANKIAVCAGWVAPVSQWNKLSREWGRIARTEGFDVFHMAEFMASNRKSPFAGWNERKKKGCFLS